MFPVCKLHTVFLLHRLKLSVLEFIGCIRTFVLNNEVQPLGTGNSGFLDSKLMGEVSEGCSGPLGCVSPPCTLSPLGKGRGLSEGVIIALVIFGILFLLLVGAWIVVRRIRLKRQDGKSGTGDHASSTKLSNIAIISQSGMTTSSGSVKADSGIGSRDLIYVNRSQNGPDSRVSLGFPLRPRSRPPSSQSGAPPPYGLHVGNGAYQNQVDTLNDERLSQSHSAERYDLDNASSIAPSDTEVSYHYRGYRYGNIPRNN